MKKHYIYLDYVKILACFMVLINHTNSVVFRSTAPSPLWFASISYFFFSKPAVSLFIMASGAVLLSRDSTYGQSMRRVLRIVVILIVFSLLYYATNGGGFSGLPAFLPSILHSQATNALWYLYLYIGILFMAPIMRLIVKNACKKDIQYLLLISVGVMGAIPILSHYFPGFRISGYSTLPIISTYLGLFVAGHYFHVYVTPTRKKAALAAIAGLLLLAVQTIATYFEYRQNSSAYLFFDNRTMITISALSFCIFYIAKYFGEFTLPKGAERAVRHVGACTFGIYLFGDMFIDKLGFVSASLRQSINPLAAVFLFEMLVFVAGLAVTSILRRIPKVSLFL